MLKRVLPKYGHMNIAEIKPIHILNYVKDSKKDGARLDGKPGKLSSSAISYAYKAFNSVLEFGKEMT
ncbi:hypothetical protein DFR56_12019 [Pseudogracilibacillus auburnensis]|uniref:Uncharacterized protein n=2 Tax=Pseudogracilibacillus auburnensis TaxID=1494959 RepID=A0A2V3VIH7_9BACI|nr:hypothetical protein DFR56_12019 [Pseudogracilibacillus auburnensis]